MARYVALILPVVPAGTATEAFHPVVADFASGSAMALLGSKGAGLVRMCQLGLPVPPGLVLTTELWQRLYGPTRDPGEPAVGAAAIPEAVWAEVEAALGLLEAATPGARLGDPDHPLLLAVRSGSAVSMPGMMTSVCNLGLNDATVAGLARRLGDRRCALDCYRRFLHGYGTAVLGLRPAGVFEADPLDALLFEYKQRRGLVSEADFGEGDLEALCTAYKEEIRRRLGDDAVPDDPRRQLRAAVAAVLGSWDTPRAREYRRLHGISEELGTAVTIQTMVFGNLGGSGSGESRATPITSAAGVAFTRDPSSGEPVVYGEFLPAAQGEDVVAGSHTPRPLHELATAIPAAYQALVAAAQTLEQHLGDMQDIEFTIEREKLWLLQTRTGKRSGRAMLKIACDLQREGRLSVEQALLRIEPPRLSELLHPTVDRQGPRILLGRGLPASPGAATGRLVMSSEAATEFRQRGEAAILARVETSSDDIVGIQAAAGVLTARGGMTSHAAVVARGMGRSAVVGASALQIDYVRQELRTREHVVRRGEIVTIDGNSGEVLLGAVPLRAAHLHHNPDYGQLMAWADQHASLQVLAEADTPAQAQLCRDLGLLGIGLSRSERLLCHPERAAVLREVCERPQSDTARERLAEALTASYRDLLATAPAGETMLRLLDPVAAGVLLAADDCELAARERALLTQVLAGYRRSPVEEAARQIPSARAGAEALHPALPSPTEVLRAIWHAQVQAIARAQQALRAQAARPVVLIPGSVAFAETAAVAALVAAERAAKPGVALLVGALVSGPEASARGGELAPHLDVLGFGLAERLPGPADPRTGEPDAEVAGLAAAIAQVRAAAGGKPLRLGLYPLDPGSSDERAVTSAARLGLDFVVCSPLRAPIGRLIAAQVRLRQATTSTL